MKLTLEFFVATALWTVNESIEMPFFRRLDEHFFALQTIFGVLHVRLAMCASKHALSRHSMYSRKSVGSSAPWDQW